MIEGAFFEFNRTPDSLFRPVCLGPIYTDDFCVCKSCPGKRAVGYLCQAEITILEDTIDEATILENNLGEPTTVECAVMKCNRLYVGMG